MRWLVILLLLANLLAWYWFSGMQTQRLARELRHTGFSQNVSQAPDVARLVMLNEVVTSPRIEQPVSLTADSKNETAVRVVTAPAPKLTCVAIGPFANTQSAESLQRSLRVVGANASLQAKDITTSVDYWVYLPPLPSPRAANRLFQELQNKKIDSYIFPGGDLENGISLGVFGKEENAIRHRNNIQERGYDAKMREIPRISREYWLDIQAPETLDLASFFEEGLPDGLVQQPQNCESNN